MVGQPEHPPPHSDSTSTVPEQPCCHPRQPLAVPGRLPLLSHHWVSQISHVPVSHGHPWLSVGSGSLGQGDSVGTAAPSVLPAGRAAPGELPQGLPRAKGRGWRPEEPARPVPTETNPHPPWPRRERQYLGRAGHGPARHSWHRAAAARGAPRAPPCPTHAPWEHLPEV